MSDEKKTIKLRTSSSSSVHTVIIDITQLHVNQLHLFHRIIEIADEVDDLTRVRINTIKFTRLSDNLDDVIEKEKVEEKREENALTIRLEEKEEKEGKKKEEEKVEEENV